MAVQLASRRAPRSARTRQRLRRASRNRITLSAAASSSYDYDLVIVGAGVGGHGAALHAVDHGMKVAVLESYEMGGTCVNRGCVPSKALLASAGRIRELHDEMHLAQLGLHVNNVNYDREQVASHAQTLATNVRGNLERCASPFPSACQGFP